MMYIKPNGDVWACPFLPVPVGNVRKESMGGIRENLEKFGYDNAKEDNECNSCEYAKVCGGCKTRMEEEDLNCPLRR